MTNVSVSLHPGYIRVSLAYQNHYVVNTDIGELTAIALETGSGRRSGHIGSGVYMPGAVVLVAVMDTQKEWSRSANLPNIILGTFDPFPSASKTEGDEKGTDFDITEQVPDSASNVNNNGMTNLLIEQDTEKILNQDRSKNRSMDVLPGEWFKSTVLGGIFLLDDFLARVGISPHCNLTFHGLSDTASLRTKNFEMDMESRFKQIAQRGFGSLEVDSYALNVLEGLGAGTAAGALVNAGDEDNPAKLASATALQAGFFRRMMMRGGDADGSWEVIKMAAEVPEYYVPGAVPAQGLFSEMRRLDGIYRLQAAKEIKLEKTGAITVPEQIADLINTPSFPNTNPPDADSRTDDQQIQDAFGLTADLQAALMPLLHKDFASYEEQTMFFKKMKLEEGIWVFPAVITDAPPEFEPLNQNAQEYLVSDLENLLTESVEVYPGRLVRLFKNSSVFLMSEDGGIVLGDGYGAEIRMNRGKITLAAAGDIDVLPGRDIRMLAPRSLIQKARDRVDISSTRNSVVIKAEDNLQLLSGNGGSGMTVIENKAVNVNLAGVDIGRIRRGDPIGSGIMLKSHFGGVSMLGGYIYGGPLSVAGNLSANGTINSNRDCDILFDSGRARTMLTGASGSFVFRDSAMFAAQSSPTGLYLDRSLLTLASAGSMAFATQGVVSFDQGQGSVDKPYLTDGGVEVDPQVLPRGPANVVIQNELQVRGSIYSKGDISAEGGMASNDGFNGQHSRRGTSSEFSNPVTASISRAISAQIGNAARDARLLLEAMTGVGIATRHGQRATDFAYPDSNSPAFNAADFFLIIPRWQQLLQTSARWVEKPVKSAILGNEETYPYPGREIYTSKAPLTGPGAGNQGVVSGSMNNYPVNSKEVTT